MTTSEKQLIYDFLKTTSKAIYGYTTNSFANLKPNFHDDKIFNEHSQNLEDKNLYNINNETLSDSVFETKKTLLSSSSISERIKNCNRCRLAQTRTNCVSGMGVENPLVLVIGEGPGFEEDKRGLPFVGPAGQLLDKMLAAISLSRKQNCYITNIVKCRPPQNRDPLHDEIQACISYLDAQITILKPKMILLVGRIAAQTLLKTTVGINSLRGTLYEYNSIPFMATYHPSALLRNQELKVPAWNDLKKFKLELLKKSPDYENSFVKEM